MYEKFYGLNSTPFGLSPDPRFLFPTPSHNEALAAISYGVAKRKGFVVLTGEVGTGKTLIVRYALDLFSSNNISCAFVCNTRLSAIDFILYILTDLKIPSGKNSKAEMLTALNEYLLSRSREGITTALIVDEAHLLTVELLEEIRLLTNLETSQYKLLQLVLVGQPELDQMIDSPGLRQLKQRISLRCHLRPLEFSELQRYVQSRLELAGAEPKSAPIFQPDSLAIMYQLSSGIPRIVNNLCENALLFAFSKQLRQITPDVIRDVAADLGLKESAETIPEGSYAVSGLDVPLVTLDGIVAQSLKS